MPSDAAGEALAGERCLSFFLRTSSPVPSSVFYPFPFTSPTLLFSSSLCVLIVEGQRIKLHVDEIAFSASRGSTYQKR